MPDGQAIRRRQALTLPVLTAAAEKYDAIFVDPTERICDATACRIRAGNIVLYADEDHLSKSGAECVAPIFEPLLADRPQRSCPAYRWEKSIGRSVRGLYSCLARSNLCRAMTCP